ncbi:MAG: Npun_R2821/Npun_R2822 family protein [Limnospira sp.]
MDGICTLANDKVYDQLVALLNSIEANQGADIPVCVYPYDDNTERIAAEINRRPQVQLYGDRESIERWDRFARQVWDAHPSARQTWAQRGYEPYHRVGTHRRYCAFDGPFDRFIYMDADALLLSPAAPIFRQLERSDWVVYDFQFKDPGHVYDLSSNKLGEVFSPDRIESEIFCSGFYATSKRIFEEQKREQLLHQLEAGEAEILYLMAPDQTVLNYMVMRSDLKVCNLARSLPADEKTGNSVTSAHFQEKDHLVYDGGKRLTYLHYIGVSSKIFARVCAGENLDFPYRETFLYYRYLHEPEKRPRFDSQPEPYKRPPNLFRRALNQFKSTFN